MTAASLGLSHLLSITSASDIHELFARLGYDVNSPEPFEGEALEDFQFDSVDHHAVRRAYVVGGRDSHQVYLFEVDDLSAIRLRGLAWNVLRRGTALLVVPHDYRDILFVDPRFAGSPIKSNVRVNKLKLVVGDPTQHDLDTLNAIQTTSP